ncbi:MAG: tyrosinase family protein [Anaerolineales bacterium]|nr:tyrosinase family protein [Anaerolineales bacterium]
MAIRKSVTNLTAVEKTQFINGVKLLKTRPALTLPGVTLTATNAYDSFVEMHNLSMSNLTPPGNATGRNAAHQGPAFLPWHREFILRFEQQLQAALGDNNFGLPYWDWAADSVLDDPSDPDRQAMVVWRDILGGNGNPAQGNHVTTGPFAHDPADSTSWTIFNSPADPGPFLKREMGRDVDAPTLPTQNDVNAALQINVYDSSPWDRTVASNSFRNQFEGWRPPLGLHNRVHVWIGGSMSPGTSPNDPAFFLHHCNVDRIWALWQACHPGVPYAPGDSVADAPAGHRLNDRMFPWTTSSDHRISDLLDISALGYSYDDFHRRFVTLHRQGSTDRFVSDVQVIQVVANCDTQNDTASTIFLPAAAGSKVRARFERAANDVLTDEMNVNA